MNLVLETVVVRDLGNFGSLLGINLLELDVNEGRFFII